MKARNLDGHYMLKGARKKTCWRTKAKSISLNTALGPIETWQCQITINIFLDALN